MSLSEVWRERVIWAKKVRWAAGDQDVQCPLYRLFEFWSDFLFDFELDASTVFYLLSFDIASVATFGLQLELDGPGLAFTDGLLQFQFGRVGAAAVVEIEKLLQLG